jgi:hypothetical protein
MFKSQIPSQKSPVNNRLGKDTEPYQWFMGRMKRRVFTLATRILFCQTSGYEDTTGFGFCLDGAGGLAP